MLVAELLVFWSPAYDTDVLVDKNMLSFGCWYDPSKSRTNVVCVQKLKYVTIIAISVPFIWALDFG